jgi:ATP-dependent Lhr-like helicase
LHLTVEPLEEGEGMGGFLGCLLDRLEPELTASRSTLVFTNTRALAERLSWALRRRFSAWDAQIAVHHSALAAARRRDVERRLKHGKLRAVISSTSLELGLDIGSVENVVLVHPPGGVVRLLQRVGRSGHAPGRPRRGRVLTTGPAELLEAAVTAASSYGGAVAPEYEPLQVPACPLDVLCQQLLGLAAQGWWSPDEAFVLAQRAYPYGDLSRVDFDDCLDYLSGRGRDGQDWLPTRLRWNEGCFTILDQRTARLLRRNLGTILAEEPRPVLARDSQRDEEPTPVGQLDERYADRLQPGDRFLLGGCCLEVRQCDAGAVYVEEVVGRPAVPRWGGEGLPLSAGLARRLYLLRTRAAEALRDGPAALVELLRGDYGLHERVAAVLAAYLQQQECVSEIPDAATCLVEAVPTEIGIDYYVHTPLNRAANDALTRIVALRLRRDRGLRCTSMVADLGFALVCLPAPELRPDDFRALLSAKNFDPDLDEALAGSVALRERFRRTALTGLMLLRNPLGGRRKVGGQDWPERRLFDRVVAADPDFVLLRQARRELRDEACDAPAALAYLEELPRRTVRCRWLAAPSPFVQGWTQLAAGPAETFESPAEVLERLHAQLTAE